MAKIQEKLVKPGLSDLIDYAAHHFLAEEQIMFSTNYSARELTNHLREHHIFWAKVQELELKGSSDKLILDFYLWLKNHINTYDHKLANYLLVSARLFNKTQQEKNIA